MNVLTKNELENVAGGYVWDYNGYTYGFDNQGWFQPTWPTSGNGGGSGGGGLSNGSTWG